MGVKRFSIEGVDALVPMLDEAIGRAAMAGARHVVIGMAHRGRLNVLTHVMGKPYRALLGEFEGHHADTNAESDTGDVKYHMGYRGERDVAGVGPVDHRARAEPEPPRGRESGGGGRGARAAARDAAARPTRATSASCCRSSCTATRRSPARASSPRRSTCRCSRGYRVGGTLHIIANNQVGFTTDPIDARSTHYASDLAKGFEIPIVHVNADDAEACIQAVRLGIAYRQRFNKDFLIDLVGYRRHGHNEADQPAFTQPLMYKIITEHPTPRARVRRAARARARDDRRRRRRRADAAVSDAAAADLPGDEARTADGRHASGEAPDAPAQARRRRDRRCAPRSSVALNEQLLALAVDVQAASDDAAHAAAPPRRDQHRRHRLGARRSAGVRVAAHGRHERPHHRSGRRARHVLASPGGAARREHRRDVHAARPTCRRRRGAFEIYNSPLSETAVLGFEYGFSIAAPDELVLWEAQYGDFANVAQPIIDQFISAGRAKWRQESGLVMLLPHGYEGQGPEHSSARLERYPAALRPKTT